MPPAPDMEDSSAEEREGQGGRLMRLLGLAVAVLCVVGLVLLVWPSDSPGSGGKDGGGEGGGGAAPKRERVFLHIADPHADPFYDYTHFWEPDDKMSRDPRLYSKKENSALECGFETVEEILENWNRTGGGPSCPCGHFGANPPFNVVERLQGEIEKHKPEFIIMAGDFVSHYLPGMGYDDPCQTARSAAKATVSLLNVQGLGVEYIWCWGNNDLLPKERPLSQEWLEEFGDYLLKAQWLKPGEMADWNRGGFFRRNLGDGLCVITLNSNSWTAHQLNLMHHEAQLDWFTNEAFSSDPGCKEFLLNAHIPLGWLDSGHGHQDWDSLDGKIIPERDLEYRRVLAAHAGEVVAEVYGHTNKAGIRLMGGTKDASGNVTAGNNSRVTMTVAGISRRGRNDPAYNKFTLEKRRGSHKIASVENHAMMRGCDYEFAYNFKDAFAPYFADELNTSTLAAFVSDKSMEDVWDDIARFTASPYKKKTLKDDAFLEAVRNGSTTAGCELKAEYVRSSSVNGRLRVVGL